VDDALLAEWEASIPGLAEECDLAASRNAPKAWRFVGEMKEIADSFTARGLPEGFGVAAADIYDRLASFKGMSGATLSAVIDELTGHG
jgi:hypothetical protein